MEGAKRNQPNLGHATSWLWAKISFYIFQRLTHTKAAKKKYKIYHILETRHKKDLFGNFERKKQDEENSFIRSNFRSWHYQDRSDDLVGNEKEMY